MVANLFIFSSFCFLREEFNEIDLDEFLSSKIPLDVYKSIDSNFKKVLLVLLIRTPHSYFVLKRNVTHGHLIFFCRLFYAGN